MIALLALLAAAPLPADAQLTCALIGTGQREPTVMDIDFQVRKSPNAAVRVAGVGPYARVSSTSPVASRADGSATIAFATGSGRFRIEVTPEAAGARARLAALDNNDLRPTVAVGFCGMRPGKRLPNLKQTAVPSDSVMPARPWRLRPMPTKLPDLACTLIGADRQVHGVQVTMAGAAGNEVTTRYAFATTVLLGASAAFGTGTQFFLVAPTERLIASTVELSGPAPHFYMHTTFERSGNWIDITRDGRTLAVGACGQPLPAIAAPPPGVSP